MMTGPFRVPDVRPLSDLERRVLGKLLRHGTSEARAYADQLSMVSVVSRCSCGCPTIDLAVSGRSAAPGSPSTILSDGEGVSPEGIRFGIILHGREGKVSELEVYSVTGEGPFTLPDAEDVHVLDQA